MDGWLTGYRLARLLDTLRGGLAVEPMILHEILPLTLAQPAASAGDGSSVRLSARPRSLRLRRELTSSESGRTWLLEVEVEVPEIDPERLLAECEDFLVDGSGGHHIGVVERVERSGSTGAASALLVSVPAGWFRRRHVRVDARAVEALVPEERRVIVDETHVTAAGNDDQLS